MLLAVETSGLTGSIALADGERLIVERELETQGRRHAQTLVAEIDQLLKSTGLSPRDVDVVAVSIGPGSFTGLRVGVTFAKTFAWLNSAKLVAVDTLRAIAQQVPMDVAVVTTVIDAQRGELFAARYAWDADAGIRMIAEPIRVVAADLLPRDHPLCGPGLAKHRTTLADSHQLLPDDYARPRAATIAFLGHRMERRSEFADPDSLEPVYIRVSYAEEKRPPVPG